MQDEVGRSEMQVYKAEGKAGTGPEAELKGPGQRQGRIKSPAKEETRAG